MDWKTFIQVMKIDEKAARAKFRAAAKAADSQELKELFEKLAYEEQVHVEVLESFERDLTAVLATERKKRTRSES